MKPEVKRVNGVTAKFPAQDFPSKGSGSHRGSRPTSSVSSVAQSSNRAPLLPQAVVYLKELCRTVANKKTIFFSDDGKGSDDTLLGFTRLDPAAGKLFIKSVMTFNCATGLLVAVCSMIFLSIYWSQAISCHRPLRWWLLFHVLLVTVQTPVRLVFLARIRSVERAQGDIETCVASLTATPAWRTSKHMDFVLDFWIFLGVLWVVKEPSGSYVAYVIYKLCVAAISQALARMLIAVVLIKVLFPPGAGVQDERPAPVAALPKQIARLQLVPFTQELCGGEPGACCAVCLSDFELGESLRRLPCGHFFHQDCCDTWLYRNKRCPVCIRSID